MQQYFCLKDSLIVVLDYSIRYIVLNIIIVFYKIKYLVI